MDLHLADRVVVVSGASSGIGAATAHRLIAEGALVGAFSRDESRLKAAFADVDPERVLLEAGDATKPDDVGRVIDAVVQRFGALHGVVANAGTGVLAPVASPPDVWNGQFTAKVGAAAVLVTAALPHLAAASPSAIAIVNSTAAHHPDPEMAPVSAARAALASYAATLAHDVARHRIRVVVVNVGVIDTDRQREKFAASVSSEPYEQWREREARRRGIPLGRMGEDTEVADTITFLLSERSAYTTGTSVDVAGGLHGRT